MKQDTLVLFTCDACGYRARIPRSFDGTAIACPSCGQSQVAKDKGMGKPRTGDTQVITMPTPAKAPAVAAPAPTPVSANDGKISFHCGSCGAKARIPSEYSGRVVRCPTCDAVQIAMPGASSTTGRIVKGVAVTTTKTATLDDNGKIIFTCSACSFSGRLSQNYAGKAISCPSCKAPQVVDALPSGSVAKDVPAIMATPVETMTSVIRKKGDDLDLGLELDAPAPKPVAAPAPKPAATPAPMKPVAATPTPKPAPIRAPTPVPASDELSLAPEPAQTPTAAPAGKPKEPGVSGRVVRRGSKPTSSAEIAAPTSEAPARILTPAPSAAATSLSDAQTVVTPRPASQAPLFGAAAAAVIFAIIAVIFFLQAGAADERAKSADAAKAKADADLAAKAQLVQTAEAATAAAVERAKTAETAAAAAAAQAEKTKAERESLANKLVAIEKALAEARAAIEKAMTNDTLTAVFRDLAPAKSALTQASQSAKTELP